MAVGTFSSVGHIPVGGRFRMSHPQSMWSAEANVTGDATGGPVQHSFMVPTGEELQHVYVIDWAAFLTDTVADPGAMRIEIRHHHELANATLDNERRLFLPTGLSSTNWSITANANLQPFLRAMPIWWRRDLGGTNGERAFLNMLLSTNNLAQVYQFRAGGRVYDARILAAPDFWELFDRA